MINLRKQISFGAVVVALLAGATLADAQAPASGQYVNWPTYNADLHGSRYLPLDQINASNFKDLEVAWRIKTDAFGTRPEFKLEGTPLAVNGIVYATAGTRRSVIAVNGTTGELLWTYGDRTEGPRAAASPRALSGRGLSYWTDGTQERIYYVTVGYRLVALDAKTGQRIKDFGNDGIVDLKEDFDQKLDPVTGEVGLHSAPAIAGNTIIIGGAMREGFTPRTHNNTKGYVRGFDVLTGKRKWIFHTIPQKGEFGYDSWYNNSADVNGNTAVWTQVSVDEKLNLAYLNVESPTSDFYGGHRPGPGLYGNSIVAVDLDTGKVKWYYQLIHHEVWDLDNSSAPLLMDVTIDGKPRQVVGIPSKQTYFYVFDRATGVPIWPIKETKVPKGNVPGEWYSPTQPIPSKPESYARNHYNEKDLIDFTPELKAKALELVKNYQLTNEVYTPPIVSTEKKLGVINSWASGGTNWPGGSFDPETGIAYVYACEACISSTGLLPGPKDMTDINYVVGVYGNPVTMIKGPGEDAGADTVVAKGPPAPRAAYRPLNIDGLPLIKPPYGTINAIDVNTGTIKWKIAHGETPDFIRNHPALKGMNIPRTGQSTYQIGTLVTKSLVVAGENQITTTEDRPRGAMLRAYDKNSGQEVGAVWMPGPQSGSPMTYMANGKQYIIVAVSGGTYSGEYIAFTLPDAN